MIVTGRGRARKIVNLIYFQKDRLDDVVTNRLDLTAFAEEVREASRDLPVCTMEVGAPIGG